MSTAARPPEGGDQTSLGEGVAKRREGRQPSTAARPPEGGGQSSLGEGVAKRGEGPQSSADVALRLWLEPVAGGGWRPRVDNRRAAGAALLRGREPAAAAALATVLFGVCARAQGLAARLASTAAMGRHVGDTRAALDGVAAEIAREHAWRLLLDWPRQFGGEPRRAEFAQLHARLERSAVEPGPAVDFLRALAAEAGMRISAGATATHLRRRGGLGQLLAAAIEHDRPAVNGPGTALLAWHDASHWAATMGGKLPAEGWCRQPDWRGAPAETGPLARCRDVPLVRRLLGQGLRVAARIAARIVELGQAAEHLAGGPVWVRADSCMIAPDAALAAVETARGLLLHVLRLDGGTVAEYRIVAPTEWNFHPAGAFEREAGVLAAVDEPALARIRRLALALDPCVAWQFDRQEVAFDA